ncbi:MAG: hypothetical protein IKW10_08505 [Oscillospiraceae bacterium]|nr:hypothetical protein [Oscillospiraceae bacterium]
MGDRRILACLLAVILLCSMGGCAWAEIPATSPDVPMDGYSSYSAVSNLYTHVNDTDKPSALEGMTLEGYEQIAQNEKLALYLRKETASIRVVNLENGYIWGALRQDQPEDLNKTWSSFGNSIVSIKYYDEAGGIAQIGAGNSKNKCSYEACENGVVLHVDFKEQGISLSARLTLESDHIRFSLEDSSIKETGSCVLGQVWFAPFLGATVGDEISGYMFVPDGSGALIRFRRPVKYLAGYCERVYGNDYSIDNPYTIGDLNANRGNDFLKDSETITMPVYGISHGYDQNALFGYVQSGAEYASIMADPAGIVTNYNYSTAYFTYRQAYLQPVGRDGAGIQMVQKTPNTVNPSVCVYFLQGEDANYSGMAKQYGSILTQEGNMPDYALQIPAMMMDFIVADIQEGYLYDSTTQLTEADQLLDAAEYLQQQGITNSSFQLLGWQEGGLNGYEKLETYEDTQLGSLQDVTSLQKKLEKQGTALSMYLAPLSVRQVQVSSENDLGIALSQEVIQLMRNDQNVFLGDIQYLKIKKALSAYTKQIDSLKKAGLTNYVTDELGSMLYAEMLLDKEMSRSQVLTMVSGKLEALTGETGLTLYHPNQYVLGTTAVYRDAPMSSSRYAFETDSVPFLQLVLSGNVMLYAPYANQSFYTDMDVLKCIEYNAYPSFLLTGSDSKELTDTPSEEYFSTCFDDWKATAVSIYQRIDQVLHHVHGQQMLDHRVLQEGVVLTEYANGSIYINYTDTDVTVNGVTVNAVSAVFVSGK